MRRAGGVEIGAASKRANGRIEEEEDRGADGGCHKPIGFAFPKCLRRGRALRSTGHVY